MVQIQSQFSYYLFDFYADAQPVISEVQKTEGSAVWENVQSLMNDLQEVDALEQHPFGSQTTQQDLYDFYESEARVQTGQPLP